MPSKPEILLARLEAIGKFLSQRDTALALIGLGSAGLELDRLDPFSDLDFFVIVKPGSKGQYLEDLSWLQEIAPIAYSYRNTQDGYKVLYKDGVFCEFAVFEEAELKTAAYAPGRIVWKAPGVAEAIARPAQTGEPSRPPSTAWLIGETLTNLYIGLLRRPPRRKAVRAAVHPGLCGGPCACARGTGAKSGRGSPGPLQPGARLRAAVPGHGTYAARVSSRVRKKPRIRFGCAHVSGPTLCHQRGDETGRNRVVHGRAEGRTLGFTGWC